jgi:hypothetical protein
MKDRGPASDGLPELIETFRGLFPIPIALPSAHGGTALQKDATDNGDRSPPDPRQRRE